MLISSSTCAAGPSVATPFVGCGMATPAPALLPALVVDSGAQGPSKSQGLPDGGWKPRNSIVRDALQVCKWRLCKMLFHHYPTSAQCREVSHDEHVLDGWRVMLQDLSNYPSTVRASRHKARRLTGAMPPPSMQR